MSEVPPTEIVAVPRIAPGDAARYRRRRRHRHAAMGIITVVFAATAVVASVNDVSLPGLGVPRSGVPAKLSPRLELTWEATLVNAKHPVPASWKVHKATLNNRQVVDARILPDLQQMMDAARREGMSATVVSGYRTPQYQQRLRNNFIASLRKQGLSQSAAIAQTDASIARANCSEHQLGLAVDIGSGQGLDSGQVHRWLAEHSWEYGFAVRYPGDKTSLTGIQDEPWHFRWVGRDHARSMHERGECLEEYVDR